MATPSQENNAVSSPARSGEHRIDIASSSSQGNTEPLPPENPEPPRYPPRRANSSPARLRTRARAPAPAPENSNSSSGSYASAPENSNASSGSHSPAPAPDPPLSGISYYLAYLFTRNYEPMRSFLRWIVVHREYLRLFWRGVALPFLAYFLYMVCYLFLKYIFNTNFYEWSSKDIDGICKCMSGGVIVLILVIYYCVGDAYIMWSRGMARRRDGARRVPGFLMNALHFVCGVVFGIGSMWFGNWFKVNSIKLHIFSSFSAFVLCMSLSRWTVEDFGLLDGTVGVVLTTIYVVFKDEPNLYYTFLLMASSLAAIKYILIPAGNAVIEWIGELDPQHRPICGNLFPPTSLMIVVALCLLIQYARYNIMESFQVGIPLNITDLCNCSAPAPSPLGGN